MRLSADFVKKPLTKGWRADMKLLENVFKAKPILYAYYDKIELPDSEMARLLATRNLWQHAVSRSYLDLIAEARDSGKEFRYEFRCGAVFDHVP
jgi:hypothetical protein